MGGFLINDHASRSAIHNWSQRFGVSLGLKLRKRRYGQAGDKWNVDATYLNVFGDYTTHRDNKHMNNRIEQDHRAEAKILFQQVTLLVYFKPIPDLC